MIHNEPHELAGQTVQALTRGELFRQPGESVEFKVEDWWDRVGGGSWMDAIGNPAAMGYGMRAGFNGLPTDDEVVYGHTKDGLGHLVHASEIQAAVSVDE